MRFRHDCLLRLQQLIIQNSLLIPPYAKHHFICMNFSFWNRRGRLSGINIWFFFASDYLNKSTSHFCNDFPQKMILCLTRRKWQISIRSFLFFFFHLTRVKPNFLPSKSFPSLSNVWKLLLDQLQAVLKILVEFEMDFCRAVLGWGSKFGTTKCRTADISKIRNIEYWNNESRVIWFFIFKFISYIYVCLNCSRTQNIW